MLLRCVYCWITDDLVKCKRVGCSKPLLPRSHPESSWLLFRLLGIWKHAVALAAVGRTEKLNRALISALRMRRSSTVSHHRPQDPS